MTATTRGARRFFANYWQVSRLFTARSRILSGIGEGGEGGVGAALLSPRGRPVRGLRGASRFAAVCVRTPGLDGRLSRDAPKASGWFRDEVTDR